MTKEKLTKNAIIAKLKNFKNTTVKVITVILLLTSSNLFSQELPLIPITVGNTVVENNPGLMLVNIFTTPYISINKPSGGTYAYNFITTGDSAGYASFWIGVFVDMHGDITAATIVLNQNTGSFEYLYWNNTMLELLLGVIFSADIAIKPSAEKFGEFIRNVEDIETKMSEVVYGLYIFGAGVPESISIRGEKMNFNEDEPIYNAQFLLADIAGEIDMCYQYFDSSEISCNYTSIVEPSTIANLLVSPNPTVSDITVSLDLETAGELTVTLNNMLGQELFEIYSGFTLEGNFHKTFSLKELPTGVYYLRISHNGNVRMEKIIKN